MPVTIRNARDSQQDREWIRAVYRAYLSELSSSQSGIFPALDWNSRENEFLAGWFSDAFSHPFVILLQGERVGFALVSRAGAYRRAEPDYRLSEFFVVESVRRRGVGRSAAELLLSRFAGEWEVCENEDNRSALNFWRRVITAHTGGRYSESRIAGEVRHRFRSPPRGLPPDS